MFKKMGCSFLAVLLFGFARIVPAQIERTPPREEEELPPYVDWVLQGRPYIEASYGLGEPKHELFSSEFLRFGAGELKLGYSSIKPDTGYVSYMEERFVFGSSLTKELDKFTSAEEGDAGKVETKMSRFGNGFRQGYGYAFGKFVLLPYNQFGLVWTKLESQRPAALVQEDIDILNRYEGVYRFGQAFEGGLKLNAFKSLAVTGSYEAAVVFPRHLFGKWLGSFTLMSIGFSAVTVFSDRIVDSSPFVGPLMYFVLRNGAAYAFYKAMQKDMNWPFDTETPLTVEAFKVGASFTF